ncbi:MAG: hypothetical protein FJW40_01300 [Acidobacteria bacterium]|nr:hypothetical protein [Acidobacteriota bacterium]
MIHPSPPTRRAVLASAVPFFLAARPAGLLIDTHIHLFHPDQKEFPYHRNASYRPPAESLADYTAFVRQSRLDHAVVVHPEPYQDDHSYLEYCFRNEPSPGFFKGTCLYDPLLADTPARMAGLVKRWPGRIVALRVHQNRAKGAPPTTSGPIRERDMSHPRMADTWRAAADLGLAIQMHFIPCHAAGIGALASKFSAMPVVLDHLARAGEGTPEEFDEVLKLARLPKTVMKFSGWGYSSKQPAPHLDLQPLLKRVHAAFGSGRIVWGGVGMNLKEFDQRSAMLDRLWDFIPEADRARIRGLNAKALYRF